MRKLIVFVAMLGLLGSGCAWLGMGDDDSVTTTQSEELQETQSEPAPEAKAEVKKTTQKSTKKAKKGAKTEAQIKEALDKKGHQLVAQSSRTLLPNINHKQVKKSGSGWVATYMHVDTSHVTTEMKPGTKGNYIGYIRYQEHIMECHGKTKEAALKAPCEQAGTRRMTELIRYDGNEWLD